MQYDIAGCKVRLESYKKYDSFDAHEREEERAKYHRFRAPIKLRNAAALHRDHPKSGYRRLTV